MKRVLPLVLLITALEIYCSVIIGQILFKSHIVNVSNITILSEEHDSNGYHHIYFLKDGKQYRTDIDDVDYKIYKQNKKLKYILADTYIPLGVLYIIFTGLFALFIVIRTVDCFVCYSSDEDYIGARFSEYESVLPDFYAEFYNYIDAYDLTPFKRAVLSFWGY